MWCIWPLLLLGCCCGNRGCRGHCGNRGGGGRPCRKCGDPAPARCDLSFPRMNVYRCFDPRTCSTDCVPRGKKDGCGCKN